MWRRGTTEKRTTTTFLDVPPNRLCCRSDDNERTNERERTSTPPPATLCATGKGGGRSGATAQEMKESLEKPRPHKRATNYPLLYTLLPGYSDAKPSEPLTWEKETPEVILAPMANMRRGDSKTSDSKINAYRSALHLLFKDFEKNDLWRAMAPVVSTIINRTKKKIARKSKEDGGDVERVWRRCHSRHTLLCASN